jgi:hypothetical protein
VSEGSGVWDMKGLIKDEARALDRTGNKEKKIGKKP